MPILLPIHALRNRLPVVQVFALLALCFLHSFAQAEPPAPKLKITQPAASAGLRIQAAGVTVASILTSLAATGRLNLHYIGLPDNQLVSGDCEGAALNEVLGCLLGSQINMVARYSAAGQAREVWLLGVNTANKSLSSLIFTDITGQDRQDYSEETEDLLEQAQSKDPQKRLQALNNMAVSEIKDPVLAKKILTEALTDASPEIRAKAVGSLASVDAENAQPRLLEMLADKNADVRLSTVIAAYNDPVVLRQAQSDSNAQVRMLAEISLNKLNDGAGPP